MIGIPNDVCAIHVWSDRNMVLLIETKKKKTVASSFISRTPLWEINIRRWLEDSTESINELKVGWNNIFYCKLIGLDLEIFLLFILNIFFFNFPFVDSMLMDSNNCMCVKFYLSTIFQFDSTKCQLFDTRIIWTQ